MSNPRKPRALKVVQGTVRKHRDRPEPEFPVVTSLEPPAWLRDPAALEVWHDMAPQLVAARVLKAPQRRAFARLCQIEAIAGAQFDGGVVAVNLASELRRWYGEFGLTPASETKAPSSKAPEKRNPFELLTGSDK